MAIAKGEKVLTARQIAFIEHYLEHGNATEAYRAAYGCLKSSNATTKKHAHELLHNEPIQRVIAAAKKAAIQRLNSAASTHNPLIQKYVIDKERAAQMLAMLAHTDARDYFEWGPGGVKVKESAALTDAQAFGVIEVSQTVGKDGGGTIKVKLADKRQALMDLARLKGWLDPQGDAPLIAPDEARKTALLQKLHRFLADMAKPEPLLIEGQSVSEE